MCALPLGLNIEACCGKLLDFEEDIESLESNEKQSNLGNCNIIEKRNKKLISILNNCDKNNKKKGLRKWGKNIAKLKEKTEEDVFRKKFEEKLKVGEFFCVICTESFTQGNSSKDCIKTSCDHFFHKKCLSKWFKTKKTVCPICRCQQVIAKANVPRQAGMSTEEFLEQQRRLDFFASMIEGRSNTEPEQQYPWYVLPQVKIVEFWILGVDRFFS
jgi:tRNA nucleotidyltransferase/poly(A) polymerase